MVCLGVPWFVRAAAQMRECMQDKTGMLFKGQDCKGYEAKRGCKRDPVAEREVL